MIIIYSFRKKSYILTPLLQTNMPPKEIEMPKTPEILHRLNRFAGINWKKFYFLSYVIGDFDVGVVVAGDLTPPASLKILLSNLLAK